MLPALCAVGDCTILPGVGSRPLPARVPCPSPSPRCVLTCWGGVPLRSPCAGAGSQGSSWSSPRCHNGQTSLCLSGLMVPSHPRAPWSWGSSSLNLACLGEGPARASCPPSRPGAPLLVPESKADIPFLPVWYLLQQGTFRPDLILISGKCVVSTSYRRNGTLEIRRPACSP